MVVYQFAAWQKQAALQSSRSNSLLRTCTVSLALVSILLIRNADPQMAGKLYQYTRKLVLRLLLFIKEKTKEVAHSTNSTNIQQLQDEEDRRPIKHKGSCHCAAVAFHMFAPLTLLVRLGTGKISYPRTLVHPDCFVLQHGHNVLQTYNCPERLGSHSFCRHCGVHLLYVPRPPSSLRLYVNVTTLEPGTWKQRTLSDDEDERSECHRHVNEDTTDTMEASICSESLKNLECLSKVSCKRLQSHRPPMTPPRKIRSSVKSVTLPASRHTTPRPSSLAVATNAVDWPFDDISETTMDNTVSDETLDDCSVRSHWTETTARDLRLHLRKHLAKPSQPSDRNESLCV